MTRFLVVEADATTAKTVERILSGAFTNADVMVAHSATEAEACLMEGPMDLLVVDQHLPSRSGAKFLSDNHAQIGKTPVIMLTGFPADKDGREGVMDVIVKPIDADHLQTTAARLLGIGL